MRRRTIAAVLGATLAVLTSVLGTSTAQAKDVGYDLPEAGVFLEGIGLDPATKTIYVSATNRDGTSDLKLAKFCRTEGARVILHEYAPWYGYHLDGSSPLEQYIDESSAEGVVHVNPAGNLSGSDKLYKREIAPASSGSNRMSSVDAQMRFSPSSEKPLSTKPCAPSVA